MEKGVRGVIIVDFICKECNIKVKDKPFKANEEFKCNCPECLKPMNRIYTPIAFNFTFKAGFDHGLGEYVDTKKDRARIMKEKGASFRD